MQELARTGKLIVEQDEFGDVYVRHADDKRLGVRVSPQKHTPVLIVVAAQGTTTTSLLVNDRPAIQVELPE